jgi:hypothetical protein
MVDRQELTHSSVREIATEVVDIAVAKFILAASEMIDKKLEVVWRNIPSDDKIKEAAATIAAHKAKAVADNLEKEFKIQILELRRDCDAKLEKLDRDRNEAFLLAGIDTRSSEELRQLGVTLRKVAESQREAEKTRWSIKDAIIKTSAPILIGPLSIAIWEWLKR